MKKNLVYILAVIQFFGYVSCKKDNLIPVPPAPVLPVPVSVKVNTAPKVNAGNDVFLYTIGNETLLNGSYSDAENNVREVRWTKISGPDAYKLANEISLSTSLAKLEKGTYEFELSVTDSLGLTGKDVVKITVEEVKVSANEIIITDRPWIFPWYNSVEVRQFPTLIPPNASYEIYIRRKNSNEWILVSPVSTDPNATYEYFVETRPDGAGIYNYGSLYIFYYGKDVSDTPDVKIVYKTF